MNCVGVIDRNRMRYLENNLYNVISIITTIKRQAVYAEKRKKEKTIGYTCRKLCNRRHGDLK